MELLKNKELMAWLEDAVKTMFETGPDSIALAAKMSDGSTLTAYYRADCEQKAVFSHHIYSDAMLDVVTNNIEVIRDAINDLEDRENEL